jgi:hypothetical protein
MILLLLWVLILVAWNVVVLMVVVLVEVVCRVGRLRWVVPGWILMAIVLLVIGVVSMWSHGRNLARVRMSRSTDRCRLFWSLNLFILLIRLV